MGEEGVSDGVAARTAAQPPPPAAQVAGAKSRAKGAAKRIKTAAEMRVWKNCPAYKELQNYVSDLANCVSGKSNQEPRDGPVCPTITLLLSKLEEMREWAQEIPLQELETQRFGNRAYRVWYGRMQARSADWMEELLAAGGVDKAKGEEIAVYWEDAFGNQTRIDYGTGHEMHFLCVLYCLTLLGAIPEGDKVACVTRAFAQYIILMRDLQSKYSMEPAGSKGVWGLDDYHHLIFLLGAAQLIDNPDGLEAKTLTTDAASHRERYLYHDGIAWILENKKGRFNEHSPTLHSVCSLPWPRIMAGLKKMYWGEVMDKWPIVQHLPFGSMLPWPDDQEDGKQKLIEL